MKKNRKRLLLFLCGGIAVCGILYVLFNLIFLDFMVDLLWFGSLKLKGYYLLRLYYRYLVFSGATLAFFLIFFLNFWTASRYLGTTISSAEETELAGRQKKLNLIRLFQSGSLKIYALISFILAIFIAIPLYEKWESALLFIFGSGSGVNDPVYGKDISYYFFGYPVYMLIQNRLLLAFILLFAGIFILYWLEKQILSKDNNRLPRGSRIHLTILAGLVVLIVTWGFFLERYSLLYNSSHMPVFFGPGFIEMRYYLPLIWAWIALFVLSAVLLIIYVHRRKGLKPLLISGLCFAAVLWISKTSFLPNMISKYIVKSNPLKCERAFIDNNIRATLAAFNLNDIKKLQYDLPAAPDILNDNKIEESIRNIPVWDRSVLGDVYAQLQGLRPYYSFSGVAVDRYKVAGRYQQVYLAARELNTSGLPMAARNWENSHLLYTHGLGAVMTPAAQGGDEPMTWFLHGLNNESDYGLKTGRADIYYGREPYGYCIAPNDIREGIKSEEDAAFQNYEGTGGVSLSSLMHKIFFSIYYKDSKIFFTTSINKKSRILFRRNIKDRIRTITPYLLLDDDPYIVVAESGLFWVQDAYTTSDKYPVVGCLDSPFRDAEGSDSRFNYIRNSVKIVVDAYNGSVKYYIADDHDPVVKAYDRAYPGLFKKLDEMPPEIRGHLRYPKYLFEMQMNVYARYHQQEPDIFYMQEDTWEFSKINSSPMKPYYLTTFFPGSEKQEFMLVSPMSPAGRANLRALAVAGCDGDNYGKIYMYNFPKGKQISGPSQVEALIAQNALISQKLTLWGQGGSEVKLGRMIILPAGNSILYIQPLYLISTAGTKIPELKRLIVSRENIVAMESTLEAGIKDIDIRMKAMLERMRNRYKILPVKPEKEPEKKKPESTPEDRDGNSGDSDVEQHSI
ncbi:uncharacterized protein BuS5_00746 [Desulfosarcina sp. BuS5]|uniref:UPF0182 family protein n=1 Tax=Desulfosarcina sp. BuS5 TaxID=933262 RepID=UPI000686B2FE|nr:UPF0182 family protein [Desulfosarcina sp. BuS5]WDN87778.1 uncharacterized protein BuS5_00746 [Desulfosarcina sp. BuS5]